MLMRVAVYIAVRGCFIYFFFYKKQTVSTTLIFNIRLHTNAKPSSYKNLYRSKIKSQNYYILKKTPCVFYTFVIKTTELIPKVTDDTKYVITK